MTNEYKPLSPEFEEEFRELREMLQEEESQIIHAFDLTHVTAEDVKIDKTIWVSPPSNSGEYCEFARLYCDDIDTLHKFAQSIGLQRSQFKTKPVPHYNVSRRMRQKALDHGAIGHRDRVRQVHMRMRERL